MNEDAEKLNQPVFMFPFYVIAISKAGNFNYLEAIVPPEKTFLLDGEKAIG